METAWWLLLIVLFILGVVLRIDLLLLLAFLLGLIRGAAWLWQRVCLDAVSYRRKLGVERLFFGEETDLRVEITNAKPLPLPWLRIEDEFATALEITPERAVRSFRPGRRVLVNLLSVRWYERVIRRYRVRGVQRGVWRIGPAHLASGDIFGFAVKRHETEEIDTLLVYPKLLPLTALGLPALRPFGELRTPRRLVEDPLQLMGARPTRRATAIATSTGRPRRTAASCKPKSSTHRRRARWRSSSTSTPRSTSLRASTMTCASMPLPPAPRSRPG